MDLTGNVALITGGGRGLGRAMGLALAAAGAKVAICARSPEEVAATARLIEQTGGKALALTADVREREDVERTVAATEGAFGPLDLLVNNAGVGGPMAPITETDPDEWWRALEVNLRGPVYATRAVLPGMLARRSGRIINVASGLGLAPLAMDASAYVVSKTALVRFTECLALETRGSGVAAFAILPGIVRTALVASALAGDSPRLAGFFQQALANERDVPPERAANLVVALASGMADALTGRVISVASDLDGLLGRAEAIGESDLLTLRLRTP